MAKRKRQKAPPPPRPTRRISDSLLMKILDPHMQDSLSDIAAIYQRLASSLGYKFMQWKEYVKAQSSVSVDDRAIDAASAIARWRIACENRRLEPKTVMLVVQDGAGIAHIMRTLKMKRLCVEMHLRACLTLYSFTRQRVNAPECNRVISSLTHCDCHVRRRKSAIQARP